MSDDTAMGTLMFAFAAAMCDKLAIQLGPDAEIKAIIIVQTPDGDIHISGSVSIPAAAELVHGAVDVLERQLLAAAIPEGPVQ